MLTLPFAEEFGGGGQPYVVYLQVILNPGEAAILALSFDHRLIDGQQGSQLLADTAAILRDPGLALL